MSLDRHRDAKTNIILQLRTDLRRKKGEYQSFLEGKCFDFPPINNVAVQFPNPRKLLQQTKYVDIKKQFDGRETIIVSDQIRRKNSGIKKFIFLNSAIYKNDDKRYFRSSVYCTLDKSSMKSQLKKSKDKKGRKVPLLPSFTISKQNQQNQKLQYSDMEFKEDFFTVNAAIKGPFCPHRDLQAYENGVKGERKAINNKLKNIQLRHNRYNRPNFPFTPWKNPQQLQDELLL